MKILKTILALFISFTATAQAVQDITYFDIPTDQVGEFIQTHKKFILREILKKIILVKK